MAAPWKQNSGDGKSKGEYDQPPAGNHPAVMVAMVDLGTQTQEYQGKVTRQRRVFCVWELVCERDTNFPVGDQNFLVAIDLNVNISNEKCKLRNWIEARKAKKFPENYDYDISQELGQPCLLNVTHNANGYAKVGGVSAVPRGMTVPPAKTRPFLWSLDDLPADGSEPDLPDWLPRLYGKRLADVIAECVELNPEKHGGETTRERQTVGADDVGDLPDDLIPF
jgi:hypothetical protein